MNGIQESQMSDDALNVNPIIGTEKRKNEIPYGDCQCGCGVKTTISPKNNKKYGWVKNNPLKFIRGHNVKLFEKGKNHPRWKGGKYIFLNRTNIRNLNHSRTRKNGYVFQSIVMAEKALGKPLPPKAMVHHFDNNSLNDKNNNLVICENIKYHSLLHQRQKAYAACGIASYRKCQYCQKYDSPKNLYIYKLGNPVYHNKCRRKYRKNNGTNS